MPSSGRPKAAESRCFQARRESVPGQQHLAHRRVDLVHRVRVAVGAPALDPDLAGEHEQLRVAELLAALHDLERGGRAQVLDADLVDPVQGAREVVLPGSLDQQQVDEQVGRLVRQALAGVLLQEGPRSRAGPPRPSRGSTRGRRRGTPALRLGSRVTTRLTRSTSTRKRFEQPEPGDAERAVGGGCS